MSCWTHGVKTTQAGRAATGAPAQPGVPIAAPNKCPICGWFTTRSGACVNPDCGARAQALQAAGAGVQPAPAPASRRWMTEKSFSPEARAYLRSLGCSVPQVTQRLQASRPEVWMYLPRCEKCGAWVSPRLGICKNPRCSVGRVGGSTNRPSKPGAWQWPPSEISLKHVQAALGRPDAHVAWHCRNAELAATIELGAFLPDLLDLHAEIVAHVRQGLRRGWLDPEDPAYDGDAQRRLEEAVDQGLRNSEVAMAVATGNWTALGCSQADVRQILNPVISASQRAEIERRARHEVEIRFNWEPHVTTIARAYRRAIQSVLAMDVLPALPPRELPPALKSHMRRELDAGYGFLTHPKSATRVLPNRAHEVYCWISKVRLARRGWQPSPDQRFRALEALQRCGTEAGYDGPLTPAQAEAILDNGWSPAEARQALRHATDQGDTA